MKAEEWAKAFADKVEPEFNKASTRLLTKTFREAITLAQQEARAAALEERDAAWRRALEQLFMTWDERPRDFEKAQQKADKLTSIIDRLRALGVDACPECGGPDDHVHAHPSQSISGTIPAGASVVEALRAWVGTAERTEREWAGRAQRHDPERAAKRAFAADAYLAVLVKLALLEGK